MYRDYVEQEFITTHHYLFEYSFSFFFGPNEALMVRGDTYTRGGIAGLNPRPSAGKATVFFAEPLLTC